MTKIETIETLSSRFSRVEITTRGKGTTETTILTAPRTGFFAATTPTEVKYTHELDNDTRVTCTAVDDKLLVQVDFADHTPSPKQSFLPNIIASWFNTTTFEQKAELEITLPANDINDFTLDATVGTLDWRGPSVKNAFSAKVNVGSVTTESLVAEDVDVNANVGSIHLKDATVHNSVSLGANLGEIKGKVSGFKELVAIADMGSIALDLHPRRDATIELKSGMGSVLSNVFGFEGKFDVKTGFGRFQVAGNGVNGVGNSSGMGTVNGWVANKNAFGRLNIDTGMGSVDLRFT
ncbi:hypothetical protein BDR26DRAFT_864950 [Obelidium mucronatum]|nr:hypothetical protein BDR26DRAFT_864950 [Obelidium mucronatum]